MFSNRSTNGIWKWPVAWPAKTRTTTSPSAMRTRCFFKPSPLSCYVPESRCCPSPPGAGFRAASGFSGFEEEFHLYAGQLDNVMVAQLMCLGIKRLAIYHREIGTFHVGNEVALRPLGNDRDLNTRLAERSKWFQQR